jgi:polyribonucleotide nucleotidyltransferase
MVNVLVQDIDNRGRIKLTMKGVDQTINTESPAEETPAE